MRCFKCVSTFLALPLKVLADDGALRQQVDAPAGPDSRRQAEVRRPHLGVGGLNKKSSLALFINVSVNEKLCTSLKIQASAIACIPESDRW